MKWQQRRLYKKTQTSKSVGLKYGFRSGLEEAIAAELDSNSVVYEFEKTKLEYTKPEKAHTYTPDFYLVDKKIFIETKGLFTTQDRQKMRLIREQYPDLDIRFVFSNSRSRISKKSSTTYGMWCVKYGFKYADKHIPKEWL
tara:strand:+ start:3930 stop:4352 length:423 start_codon:yes stop_codon:yes gene_type:complete